MYFLYILRCSDDSYYVGSTTNVDARLIRHNLGLASGCTAKRLPVRLAFSETHATLRSAVARERQVKRWTRVKKAALIAGNLAALKRL